MLPDDISKTPDDIDRMVAMSNFMYMQRKLRNEKRYGRDASDLNIGHTYLQINGIRKIGSAKDAAPLYYWVIPSKISDPGMFADVNRLADLLEEFDSLTGLSYDKRTDEYSELIRRLSDKPSVESFLKSQEEKSHKILNEVEKITGRKYSEEELEKIHAVALQIDPLIWSKEIVDDNIKRTQNGLASKVIEQLALSNISSGDVIIRRPIDRNAGIS